MARCTVCEHECDTERVITLAGQPLLFDRIACALATPTLSVSSVAANSGVWGEHTGRTVLVQHAYASLRC